MMVSEIIKRMVSNASAKYSQYNTKHIEVATKSIDKDADLSPLFFLIVLIFSCSVVFALPHIKFTINPHFILFGGLSLLFVLYFYAEESLIANAIEKKSVCPHCHKEFSYFFDRKDSREDEPYQEDKTEATKCPFETKHTISTYVKTHSFDVRKCLACGQEDEENETESVKCIKKTVENVCDSCGSVNSISMHKYRKNEPTYEKRQSHERVDCVDGSGHYQENWVSVKTIQPFEVRAVYTCSKCGRTEDIHLSSGEKVVSKSDKEGYTRTYTRRN